MKSVIWNVKIREEQDKPNTTVIIARREKTKMRYSRAPA